MNGAGEWSSSAVQSPGREPFPFYTPTVGVGKGAGVILV